MKRSIHAAVVVAVTLLVAFHAPAVVGQTSGTLVVGSQHSTAEDFENATTNGLDIVGSGESAYVTGRQVPQTIGISNLTTFNGDVNAFEIQSATTKNSDEAISITGSDYDITTSDEYTVSQGDEMSVWVHTNDTNYWQGFVFAGQGAGSGQNYGAFIDWGAGNLDIRKDLSSSDVGESLSSTSFQPSANTWYRLNVTWARDGTITVELFDDSGTKLASTSSTDTSYTDGQIGFFAHSSGTETYTWDEIALGEFKGGTYEASHSISNGQEVAINITQASNVSVDATVRTDGGTVLGSDTITSTGNHTISLSETSSESLETVLDVTVTGSDPQFELSDESILFNNNAPEIDNGSASPTGEISTSTPTLSVDLSDAQFGSAQGEELNVDWYVDGEQVDSTTETSNGTASIQIDAPETGGQHNWSVEVTDQYGATTESETFEFSTPSELTIRNISAPNNTISGATAELTFYYNDETTRLSDDDGDGVIDMAGLPTDEKFVVVVDAEGYYRRHIIINSIYEQSAVYLLPENASTVETRFQIDDPTGEFQAGTTEILVQRSVERDFDGDGDLESRFTTVAADEGGVAGFTTALEEDARYRLIVRNQAGDTRVLGSYTATVAETVVLEPTPLGVELGNETAYNATARQVNTSTGEQLVFEFADGANETTDLTLAIWEQGNRSNNPSGFQNITFDGPLGQVKHVEPLESDEDGTTWVVRYEATRNGNEIAGEYIVGPNIQDPFTGAVPTWIKQATAIVTLVLVAGLFSQLNAGVGAVTTSIVGGGFWWLGFLPPAAGGAVVIALFASILYKAGGDV